MIDIETHGLKDFDRLLQRMGGNVVTAARQSVNEAAVFARRVGSREIRDQINFKAGYLDGRGNANARLAVTRQARDADLEAVVTGRDRPTSLARFRVGAFIPRGRGARKRAVRVRVSASGGPKTIRDAFYIRLRQGAAAVTDDQYNEGIAIRLKPGERISNKRAMSSIGGGLYVLYGPSVGQVYRTVAPRTVDAVGLRMQDRFTHNLQRLLRG